MRQLALAVAALSIAGCCCDLKKESYAKVPLTLSDAKKLDGEITVERRTGTPSGMGGCGHSAACVILLPIALYERLFPASWDEVVVKKDGEVVLFASYETDGALIHAQHVVKGEIFETRNIVLRSLGKRVYVDSARIVPQPDGGAERVVIPLSTQHDFIADMKKYLADTKDPVKRGAAIHEAAVVLEQEGVDFALERLRSPDEPDAARAELVRLGCKDTKTFAPLMPEAKKTAGPLTKLRLSECVPFDTPERDEALLELIAPVCADSVPLDALDQFEVIAGLDGARTKARALELFAKCPAGGGRALVGLWLNQRVETADLTALLATKEKHKLAFRRLHLLEANQRAAMVKELAEDGDEAFGSSLELLKFEDPLEPTELSQLAQCYTKKRGLIGSDPRGRILSLFARAARAPDAATRARPARDVLEKALATEKPGTHHATLSAGLVVLGDRTRIADASKGLEAPITVRDSPVLDDALVAWALMSVGCSREELQAAAEKKAIVKSCSGK